MDKQSYLIIIPARKGSKSIKNKNIKLFCGKPLIYWTIILAIKSNLGRVVVSTDSKKIQKYALSLGAESPFLRPEKLAQDNSPSESVVNHAINFYKEKNINFDYFILLQPTSPFRVKNDLINACSILKKNKKCTSVFSVSLLPAYHNPHWLIKINKDKKAIKFVDDGKMQTILSRRQLLPKVYYRNDFFYLSKVKNILSKKPNMYGDCPMVLITKEERINIDINTMKEWTIAENLFKKEILKKEYLT